MLRSSYIYVIWLVRESHKATTQNCVAWGGEEHDIFLRKLIQWLGLLRNMSRSSCVCKCNQKECHPISCSKWCSMGEGYVTVFLHLCDLVSKRKPQGYYTKLRRLGEGRARHIPTQTDTVVRFAPEHVVLFLCLQM